MHRRALAAVLLVPAAAALGLWAAGGGQPPPPSPPSRLELPRGFQPEGIAAGAGGVVFVGSLPTGAVYRLEVGTGRGAVHVPAAAGRAAVGLEEAGGRLWVAGGDTGRAFVYDAVTGADVAQLTLASGPSFVNDVVVTSTAAYFTDSLRPVLYRVDRADLAVTAVALAGDLVYADGFNVNGIDATADGRTLVLVQTNTGRLFTADPRTGATRRIELAGGESVPGGDGILLVGRRLFVVQNVRNVVAEVRLAPDLASGSVVGRIASATFDVPTTVARVGAKLYVVNFGQSTGDPQTADYGVVAVDLP